MIVRDGRLDVANCGDWTNSDELSVRLPRLGVVTVVLVGIVGLLVILVRGIASEGTGVDLPLLALGEVPDG